MSLARTWLLWSLVGVAALGCVARGVKPREYLLAPTSVAVAAEPLDLRLGVGPVTVPDYLDRPNLVTRIAANELAYSERHRWGEPLGAGMARVVATNLATLLPVREIETYPWRSLPQLDYRITMEVERFERGPDGRVLLEVRWFLADGRHGRVRQASQSRLSAVPRSEDTGATVAAMSEAAGLLSAEIADAIRQRVGR